MKVCIVGKSGSQCYEISKLLSADCQVKIFSDKEEAFGHAVFEDFGILFLERSMTESIEAERGLLDYIGAKLVLFTWILQDSDRQYLFLLE